MSKRKIENVDISAAKSIILPPEEELKASVEREKQKNIDKQAAVEAYNDSLSTIDPIFAAKTFVGTEIKVRLKKQDYVVKNSGSELTDGIKKDNLIAMEASDGSTLLVDNPLPFMFEGIITAIPAVVKRSYSEEYGIDLEVGSYVELREFTMHSNRYYLDKNKVDTKISQEAIEQGKAMFPNHEGYFSVSVYDIESIM